MYELYCEFPGDTKLTIQVMDHDFIGDDLIGETIINLEDRFFNP